MLSSEPARTTAKASSGPPRTRAASTQAPVEKRSGGMPAQADGGNRHQVGEHDHAGGKQHGAGVRALRIVDFGSDGGGVVPTHVVPHGYQDGTAEVEL